MKTLIKVLVLCIATTNVSAREVEAPLGLTWGDTIHKLRSKGVSLNNCRYFESHLIICDTTNPPRKISFAENYGLIFHKSLGLQKVVVIGKNFTRDLSGSDGKKLYNVVKKNLMRKYGSPKHSEITGLKLYKESDEFYQCLDYAGCGLWMSIWSPQEGGAVMITIKPLKRGVGFLQMVYDSKLFQNIEDKNKREKESSDLEAL